MARSTLCVPSLLSVACALSVVTTHDAMANGPPGSVQRSSQSVIEPCANVRITPRGDTRLGRATRTSIILTGGRKAEAFHYRLEEGAVDVEVGEATAAATADVVGGELVEVAPQQPVVVLRSPREELAVVVAGTATVRIEDGHLVAINRNGRVLAGNAKHVRPLLARHAQSFACASGSAPRIVPPTPSFTLGRRLWLASGGKRVRPNGLSWSVSDTAIRYRVRVTSEGGDLTLETTDTTLGDQAPELGPGRYDVTVQPIDECGIEGAASEPARLQVLGMGIPLGGYVDDEGVVRAQVGDSVRLTNAEQVLISFPQGKHWLPAPKEIRLHHAREQKMYLRGDELSTPLVLRIAPRDVDAQIDIGPQGVTWPGQDVQVKVRLRSGSGNVPDWIEPVPRLMIGLERIYVPWKRKGAELHATIPPQPGNKPCVIRVEVTDQYGIVLGRSFMEVARGGG